MKVWLTSLCIVAMLTIALGSAFAAPVPAPAKEKTAPTRHVTAVKPGAARHMPVKATPAPKPAPVVKSAPAPKPAPAKRAVPGKPAAHKKAVVKSHRKTIRHHSQHKRVVKGIQHPKAKGVQHAKVTAPKKAAAPQPAHTTMPKARKAGTEKGAKK